MAVVGLTHPCIPGEPIPACTRANLKLPRYLFVCACVTFAS